MKQNPKPLPKNEDRVAAALRENLRKRKLQQQAKAEKNKEEKSNVL